MSSNLELPIVELEGVGPHIAAVLAPLGVSTIGDLLRVPSHVLHASVAAMASEKQVGAWRQMACFLEIPAMTPQWAEALIWREICTHVDLCQTSYAQLLAQFEAAKAARRIDTVPEPAAL